MGESSIPSTQINPAPLPGTTVEKTHPAARDGKIEVVLSQVTTGIGGLDYHGLTGNGTRNEGQPTRRCKH